MSDSHEQFSDHLPFIQSIVLEIDEKVTKLEARNPHTTGSLWALISGLAAVTVMALGRNEIAVYRKGLQTARSGFTAAFDESGPHEEGFTRYHEGFVETMTHLDEMLEELVTKLGHLLDAKSDSEADQESPPQPAPTPKEKSPT